MPNVNEVPYCPQSSFLHPQHFCCVCSLETLTETEAFLGKYLFKSFIFSVSLKAPVVLSPGISFSGQTTLASSCDLSGDMNSTELPLRSEDSRSSETDVKPCEELQGPAGRFP